MTGLGFDTVGMNTYLLYQTRQVRSEIQKAREEKTVRENQGSLRGDKIQMLNPEVRVKKGRF